MRDHLLASMAAPRIASWRPTLLLVEQLTNDLRRRWEQGERSALEAYLNQHPSLRDAPEAVVDLIYEEVLLREAQGEEVLVSEYLDRFPQYAAQIRDQFEAHQALGSCPFTPITPTLRLSCPGPAGSLPVASCVLPAVRGYEIEAEIGRGGMGVVYRALDVSLKRRVALKMIGTDAQAQPQALARFQNEALAIARLHHPHIVQIHEVGEQDGRPYLALELVEGGTLAHRLHGRPQPARTAAHLAALLARAIHAAHEAGVVHRDLKPANILLQGVRGQASAVSKNTVSSLTPDPWPLTPKIADFGLAKCLDPKGTLTQSGSVMGTPCYMAPEQARAKTGLVGPPVDIYSLGAILYELLTGRPPFQGETHVETVLQVLNAEPLPPRRWQPSVPRDLETICLKCLEKSPGQRYPSAQAVAEDLDRFLAGEPIQARPAGPWERAVKWGRRRPLPATLLGTSSLAVLGLLLVSLLYSSRLHWYNQELTNALQTAQEQRDEAERAGHEAELYFQKAMQAVGELSAAHADKDLAQAPHMERQRLAFLQKALAFYEDFLQTKSTNPVVRLKTAEAYGRVAALHVLLGEVDRAEKAYRQAVDLHQLLVTEAPEKAAYRHELGKILHGYAMLLQNQRRFQQAESMYRRALTLHEELTAQSPGGAPYRHELARHYHNLGTLLRDTNRRTEAEAAYCEAVKLDEKLAAEFPQVAEYRQELAKDQHHLAHFRAAIEPEKSRLVYLAVLEIQKKLVADFPDVPGYRHELARSYHSLGELLRGLKEWSEAVAANRQAVLFHQKLAADFPAVPAYRRELARHYYNLALAHKSAGQLTEAKEAFRQAQTLCQKLVDDFPARSDYQSDLLRVQRRLEALESGTPLTGKAP